MISPKILGVAVYLDDILVSGSNEEDHLHNLRCLLERLRAKGLRCRKDKCTFAESSVEYLGNVLSEDGIRKGPKVDAVLRMPPQMDVSSFRSFLGSLQFYAKFLPPTYSKIAEPLYKLTKKKVSWRWGVLEKRAFYQLRSLLSTDDVLIHFDPSLPLKLATDTSQVVGATRFHRLFDGSERPIANASKTLAPAQRRYSQLQKEAWAFVFSFKKFYQFLYGRHFLLVTDHKPFLTLFGPSKPVPALVANRLAR